MTRNGYSQYRQITAIDHLGRTAHFSGSEPLGNHNAVTGEQCVAAGNMLADRAVIKAMVKACWRSVPAPTPAAHHRESGSPHPASAL
ncbi:putative Ntn-hydrolase superfamily protein [Pseudomonas sp. F-14 TE3623]